LKSYPFFSTRHPDRALSIQLSQHFEGAAEPFCEILLSLAVLARWRDMPAKSTIFLRHPTDRLPFTDLIRDRVGRILCQALLQVGTDHLSQTHRFQNLTFRTKAQDPSLNFIQAGNPEGDLKTAIRELGDLLALVPKTFVSRQGAKNAKDCRAKLLSPDS